MSPILLSGSHFKLLPHLPRGCECLHERLVADTVVAIVGDIALGTGRHDALVSGVIKGLAGEEIR